MVRHGPTRHGIPSFRCRGCGRRFVAAPKKGPVPEERKDLIRRPLGKRLSLRAIARVVGVSRSWLREFVNGVYDQMPWEPGPLKKRAARS